MFFWDSPPEDDKPEPLISKIFAFVFFTALCAFVAGACFAFYYVLLLRYHGTHALVADQMMSDTVEAAKRRFVFGAIIGGIAGGITVGTFYLRGKRK